MKYILLLFLAFGTLSAFGQDKSLPVKWSFDIIPEGKQYVFKAIAKLDDNWAIYSQHTEDGGPVALKFFYDEKIKLEGETIEESEAIKKMSNLFEVEVIKYKKEAIFTQRFSNINELKTFSGSLKFMCCDEQRCLAPTVIEFDIAI